MSLFYSYLVCLQHVEAMRNMSIIIIRCNLNSHCGANFKKRQEKPCLSSDIKKLAEHLLLDCSTSFFLFQFFQKPLCGIFLSKAFIWNIIFKRKQAVSVSSVSFKRKQAFSVSFEAYQRSTRSASGMNILLSGLMSKASYHALMCGKAPSTRH